MRRKKPGAGHVAVARLPRPPVSRYHAERLRSRVESMHDMELEGVVRLPNGWGVAEATQNPLSDVDLGSLPDELAQVKSRDRWRDESYPERLAMLSRFLMGLCQWSPSARAGVAWATLFIGMHSHGYTITAGFGLEILDPPTDMFDRDERDLAQLYRRAFAEPGEPRRHWRDSVLWLKRARLEHDATIRAALPARRDALFVSDGRTRLPVLRSRLG